MTATAKTSETSNPAAFRVEGTCEPRFNAVRDQFELNLVERGEVGASVHVIVDGEVVVDLWGGTTEPAGSTPWTEDTAVPVFSCTKGATALAAHLLIDRGLLELDAPVGDYWPEFATNGKETATVRMMLDHTVGVPALRDRLPELAACDFDLMAERVAAEKPWWEPGTRNGYHMLTFGWTVGELVRRVSGRSLGRFFADELADPLAADFWIGLPPEQRHRVAPITEAVPDRNIRTRYTKALIADPDSLPALAWNNKGDFEPNDPRCQAAEIGGGGGIANARGLARLYQPLAAGGDGLFSARAVTRMGEVAVATHCDATLLMPTRFGLGFMKSMDNRDRAADERSSVIWSSAAFGHVGAGGSVGFADPEAGVAFGYAMTAQGPGLLLNPRGQSLVDATYRTLGYTDDQAGVWAR